VKKDQKSRKNPLRVHGETLRHLERAELKDVVGGTALTLQPSICHPCFN
jgi:hypothetical protein